MTTKTQEPNPVQRHDNDTGSTEVQIWLLSKDIQMLQGHLQSHAKDFDAKRSLLKKVAKRRKFLKILKEHDLDTYTKVAQELGLKV
jgi:small subunit ribosomal protein S15